MTYRYTVTILIFLFAADLSIGQTFKQGYVRLKSGIDKGGLIGEIVPGKFEAIQYKAMDSDSVTLFYANEVAGYGVGDTFYTAFLNPDMRWSFVELLVEGEMTLLRRSDMYFVISRSSNQVVHLDGNYKATLRSLMANCPWVGAKARGVKFNKTDISDYVRKYNECVATSNPDQGMPRTVAAGLILGYENSRATFTDARFYSTRYLAASPLRDKSLFQIGVDVTFKTYKVSPHVGIYTGAIYNANRYHAVTSHVNNGATEVNEYSINYKELRIPLGLEITPQSSHRLGYHLRAGVIFPKMITLTSTHPRFEIDPKSDGHSYSEDPSYLVSFKTLTMLSVAAGIDWRVLSKSRIRVQAGVSTARVDATASQFNTQTRTTGRMLSTNVIAGFVF